MKYFGFLSLDWYSCMKFAKKKYFKLMGHYYEIDTLFNKRKIEEL